MRSMNRTPSSAIIEPTESSMPPVMITKAWAIENSPNSPTRFAVLAMLMVERKRGLISATTAPTTMMRTSSPRSFFSIG